MRYLETWAWAFGYALKEELITRGWADSVTLEFRIESVTRLVTATSPDP